MSNNFYEEAKVLMYNSKYNGVKQSGGKQSNLAHAVSHITKVSVSQNSEDCSSLQKSLHEKSSPNNFPLKRIENLFHNITKRFNLKNHEAEVEGDQIGKVLQTGSEIFKFVMENKKILKGLERMARKEMEPNENGFGPNGSNGFDNGFGSEGGRPGSGNGFGNGFDNGFGRSRGRADILYY